MLAVTPEVAELAAGLIARVPLAPRAGADAGHIARRNMPRDGFSPDLELCPYRER
jgi:hypothetical protein